MIFAGVPYLIGYLLLSYAHYSPTATAFKTLLMIGRFVSGVGMGWASTASSVRAESQNKLLFSLFLF